MTTDSKGVAPGTAPAASDLITAVTDSLGNTYSPGEGAWHAVSTVPGSCVVNVTLRRSLAVGQCIVVGVVEEGTAPAASEGATAHPQPDATGADVDGDAKDYTSMLRAICECDCGCGRAVDENGERCPMCSEACGPDATGAEDGAVGRFLAFAACQRDDEDRAICDEFHRAFVRACEQLDDTQRRLQATEDARQRVCFARDRFAEQLEVTIERDNRDAQRIATIADEAFGPFPVQTCDENLSAIERGIFGLRQRIGRLEAERKAVADVASEGDVEDLLDALDNLAADPKDGETWGMRYQTASALHDAWQDERQRRGQAEQDAERWHRLFDEGATLMATVAAERDALAAEVARLTAARTYVLPDGSALGDWIDRALIAGGGQ